LHVSRFGAHQIDPLGRGVVRPSVWAATTIDYREGSYEWPKRNFMSYNGHYKE
jgi:hypothetical protein